MNELTNQVAGIGATPILKSADGSTLLSVGHIFLIAVGVVGLYYFIPERKRQNLFK